jgi:hypothetical protein
MPGSYVKIQSVTVTGATAADIDIQNIPATFDDLLLRLSLRGNRASVDTEAYIKFNNNTSNYSSKTLFGTGSTAGSATSASYPPILMNAANATASTFASIDIYIPNYAGSTNKSLSSDSVSETNATGAYQYLVAGLWSNTAVIDRITITPSTDSFVTNSTAVLYGIKKS